MRHARKRHWLPLVKADANWLFKMLALVSCTVRVVFAIKVSNTLIEVVSLRILSMNFQIL